MGSVKNTATATGSGGGHPTSSSATAIVPVPVTTALAYTGAPIGQVLFLALGLLIAGLGLMILGRRRRRA